MSMYTAMTAYYLYDVKAIVFPTPSLVWKPTDPLVSAAHILFFPSDWPKTLILVSGATSKMEKAGAQVCLVEVPHVSHAYWALPFFKECEVSLGEFTEFIKGGVTIFL